jgi:REP element-mobilizing transposase RayT
MADTYASLHYPIVFSTKNREPFLRQDIVQRVSSDLGGIERENEMKALAIGGVENHIHLLLGLTPALAISKAVQLIKGGSSGWAKETLAGLRGFAGQGGYTAFTVSKSLVPEVNAYIRAQREHHRLKSFEEEYRAFLAKHETPFEERYLFDGEFAG